MPTDKKFLSISDLFRLLGDGVVNPEAKGEVHVGYKLSRDVFLKGTYLTVLSTVISTLSLSFIPGFSVLGAIACGMALGIMIGAVWAILVSGERGSPALEREGYDLKKRPMIGRILGDMRPR